MSQKPINVAIVGLSFGAEFIPIYQRYPNASMYAICQRDPKKLKEIGDQFGVEKRFTDYDEMLRDPNIDAVHINTPVNLRCTRLRAHATRRACSCPCAADTGCARRAAASP